MNSPSKVPRIAFVGDHLPRKCGIATFTADLLAAVQSAHPQSQCLAVSVNDIPGGYEYPEVVRFEIEERTYRPIFVPRTSSTSVTWTSSVCNTSSAFSAGRPVVTSWHSCAN